MDGTAPARAVGARPRRTPVSRAPAPAALSPELLDTLRKAMVGRTFVPDDPGYDEARSIWNGMVESRPGLVVEAASVEDVRRTVGFVRENDLLLAIRGGGHNIAGLGTCEGGVMLSLRRMNAVEVDVARRRARVGPGATLAHLDAATQAHGLATPVGINSTTGVAGLTLGGGFGWLSRKHGMTVDNLISAQVVTTDGFLLTASETENDPTNLSRRNQNIRPD